VGEVRETLRPPLLARLRPVHWAALDAAAVAYACVLADWILAIARHVQHPAGLAARPAWLDWAAVLLASVPVAARRRYPLTALGMAGGRGRARRDRRPARGTVSGTGLRAVPSGGHPAGP
jgi:hypothetical protein